MKVAGVAGNTAAKGLGLEALAGLLNINDGDEDSSDDEKYQRPSTRCLGLSCEGVSYTQFYVKICEKLTICYFQIRCVKLFSNSDQT